MKNSGQLKRADNLNALHSDIYNTDDYKYDLNDGGSIEMKPDSDNGRYYTKYKNNPNNTDGRIITKERNPKTGKFSVTRETEDPRKARRQASAMNRFTGTNDYKPQDFRL
jgi:hypothetical protein